MLQLLRLLLLFLTSSLAVPLYAAPLQLTPEEQQWLVAHPVIRLGVDPNWAPFEYLDEEGNYHGIAADYVTLLGNKLGVEFQPVRDLSWAEVMERARQHELDLLPAAMRTPQREQFLTFTPPYVTFPMVIISRDDAADTLTLAALEGKRVGVVQGYVTEELLRNHYPGLVLIPCTTIDEGLQALALGNLDAFVDNLASATHTIQALGISGLRISGRTPYDYPLAFAVRNDWPEFAAILSKALASIDNAEHQSIEDQWVHVKEVEGIELTRILAIATPVASVITLFVASLLYWNHRLQREIARRREIEAQLQSSNRSLSDSQEIAHVGSWEWDIVSGELHWSDEIYRIFGLIPREFDSTYEAFLERVHPDDRQKVIAAVNATVNDDAPYDIMHRLIQPNGTLRIVNERGRIYRDRDGKPVRMLGVVHDITSLKQVENNLRQERDTAQRYLDIAGVMFLILNREGQITLINRHGLLLLGYDNEQQVLGLNWFDHFIAAEQRAEIRKVFSQLMNGDIALSECYVNPIIDRHGNVRWITWQNILLHDEHGTITGALSSGQDISEQRRNEEKLRLSDKVFEASSEAILITDHENRIITANPGLLQQTGYELHEIVGKDPKLFRSGRHDIAFYEKMWQTLLDEGHWAGEVWDRRKDGSVYPKWLSIDVVREPLSQRVTHHVAIFTDLSQHKAAEEQIRYLAHHDPLTELPNRLLLQDRLQQALNKAQRNHTQVAVLFVDLDHFKPINDTLGHHVGDLLLQEIARRLQGCVRSSDTVARLGGDEFVIVLEEVEKAHDIHRVAQTIVEEASRVAYIEGDDLYVTASIGISLSSQDGDDADTLIRHADSAMYSAKKRGRGNYHFFSAPAFL